MENKIKYKDEIHYIFLEIIFLIIALFYVFKYSDFVGNHRKTLFQTFRLFPGLLGIGNIYFSLYNLLFKKKPKSAKVRKWMSRDKFNYTYTFGNKSDIVRGIRNGLILIGIQLLFDKLVPYGSGTLF